MKQASRMEGLREKHAWPAMSAGDSSKQNAQMTQRRNITALCNVMYRETEWKIKRPKRKSEKEYPRSDIY
jgi:hypothetical protein